MTKFYAALGAAALLLPGFTGRHGAPILAGCVIVQRHGKPYPALSQTNGRQWHIVSCKFEQVVNHRVVEQVAVGQ